MVEPEVEVSEWQKLPSKLQLQFYERAGEKAREQADLLRGLKEKIEGLHGRLEGLFKPVPGGDWEGLRVAVVDGSSSPMPDTRLLGRYAVYCAGYHIYEGPELVDEGDFVSGVIFRPNEEGGPTSRAIIGMLTTLAEREIALDCARRDDVDYVIVDGAFFGYIWRCIWLREHPVEVEGIGSSTKLVDMVVGRTLELLKTGKAIGIIKRVRLRAIDGWLMEENADYIGGASNYEACLARLREVVVGAIDKAILSMVMPPGAWFSYRDLLVGREAGAHHYYSRLAISYPERVARAKAILDVMDMLEHVRKHMEKRLKLALGDEGASFLMNELERHYIKASLEAPACCLEAPRRARLEPMVTYCASFSNEDTGHPFPLDLIDDDVTLPRLFTREFVQEVEARLLEQVKDLEAVRRLFAYLNPQKKWRA